MDFLRSSNATTGGDGSRYYCDAGGCEDQYGGVIGKAVGNVAQAIRIDGDLQKWQLARLPPLKRKGKSNQIQSSIFGVQNVSYFSGGYTYIYIFTVYETHFKNTEKWRFEDKPFF